MSPGVGRRGENKNAGGKNFDRAGALVGVAWDATAGALLVSVDGSDPVALFPSGIAPGPAVGAGLFPAVSGQDGCRVRWNAAGPFRYPPPDGFRPFAAAAAGAPGKVRVRRAALRERLC